jgi:hypothetical protein
MVREDTGPEPVPPVGDGAVEGGGRFFVGLRGCTVPREGDKGRLTFLQGGTAITPCAHQTDPETAGQRKAAFTLPCGDSDFVIPVSRVGPVPWRGPVVEEGNAVDQDFHPASNAGRRAHERAGRRLVAGRPPVLGAPSLVGRRLDDQEVMHQQPTGRRVPGRLENHGAGHVATLVWHLRIGGTEPERTGTTVEQRAKDAGRVGAGQAEPFDRSVWRH